MKKKISFLIAVLCIVFTANATETSYLKIKLDNQKEISYPPGVGFIAQDADGNTVLSPSELETIKVYEVQMPITLFVFTTWNDEPDVYEISSGTLSLGETDIDYNPDTTYTYGRAKKGETYGRTKKGETYGRSTMMSNGLSMTRARYFANDAKTGYNASIEFSNDVIFYYRDGAVSAWQNGKDLEITGNYLIKTNKGIIKLSYDPSDKELWWVFDKN
ncbi:hypothetical protein [uncultured Dokdonia sp.]|uniref:hypothetical protein n=1 Tax=uncultured Dokdonia sp. TaxID=575653 RepID=UPI0026121EA1|nr:hypothetical protein [uncultured Dokdonia sp.]